MADALKQNGNGDKKAKSRRFFVIEIFGGVFIVNSLYVLYGIPFIKDFDKFITYFLITQGAIIGLMTSWVTMTTLKKKKEV